MSVTFAPPQKSRPSPSPAQIQKMLDENSQLIQGIVDYQNKGKATECLQYQQILHRNLVYLASIADAVPSLLPPPPQIPGNTPQMNLSSEPSPASPSGNSVGPAQQYGSTGYSSSQNQTQHASYNNMSSMQNASGFSNEIPPSNYSAPTSQGNFGQVSSSSPAQPSTPVPTTPQQQQPPPQPALQQPPQQQTPPQQQSPQQQPPQQQQQQPPQLQAVSSQAHASPPQEFPNNSISQTTVYNQPSTTTTAQSYTSQNYSPQTQSYAPSGGPSQWYPSANAQNSVHPNYSASQDYTGPSNHSFSAPVPNQSNYNSNPAPTTQPQNFPASSTSPQVGFSQHPPPAQAAAAQESNSSPTPVQQNRFPASSGNYQHSGYMHYRPPASQQPSMGSPMGPPSGNVHRAPSQPSGGSTPQGQNYNYEQSHNYAPYQPQ